MPRPRPWTDDELREAVRLSTTLQQVCHRLGVGVGGQTYASLREGMDRLGLRLTPVSPDDVAARLHRSWTDDQLRDAVSRSTTLKEVCAVLGLRAGGRTYENLRRHIARLAIVSEHLPLTETRISSTRSWTDDELREVVRESRSVSEVLRRLGYVPSGGMHRYLKAKMQSLDMDTRHFTGQSWSRGRTFPQGHRVRPLEEILVEGSIYGSGKLRQRLIAAGLKSAHCEVCGISEWQGRPLTLQLDHVNGNPVDNRLANLRILCPNCHSQTDTWCRATVTHSS